MPKPRVSPPADEVIAAYAREHPDATAEEIGAVFDVAKNTIRRALTRGLDPEERAARELRAKSRNGRNANTIRAANARLDWLGGVLDAAAFCSSAKRRVGITHRDRAFLDRVREIAACGSITTRQNGTYQWTVEGTRAVGLARDLRPHMLTTLAIAED